MKIGEKMNRWTCISNSYLRLPYEKAKQKCSFAIFKCDCGTEKEYKVSYVSSGRTKSCGCYLAEIAYKTLPSSKYSIKVNDRYYDIWRTIKRRCYDSSRKDYIGNNIKMCDEWLDYESFHNWCNIHYKPKMCLNRHDWSKDFCPDNCFFDTKSNYSKINYKNTKDKINKTNIEKYGSESFSKTEFFKTKVVETNRGKYGTDWAFQNNSIKEKIKQSVFNKYGVEYYSSTNEAKNKISKTCLEKYGVTHYTKTKEYKDSCKKYRKIINGMSYYDMADILNKSISTVSEQVRKFGFEYAINPELKMTGIEYKLKKWLDENNISYIYQKYVNGKKPDFTIGNLIIEVNGNYWHSDAFIDDKNHHRDKMTHYKNNGYLPLFFAEDEVNDKFHIVTSIINNKLNLTSKIFARKCSIKNISKEESDMFFNANHLMGSGSGKTIALFLGENIVCAMRYINKKNEIHISRFCTRLNTSVIGGFSKLLKQVRILFNEKPVINFIDMRYGNGSYLESLGFNKEREQISFVWTDFKNRYHRMNFPSNSGYDKGLYKIWDCGQAKYVLHKKM